MQWPSVIYFVVTIFVIVSSALELCKFEYWMGENAALCGKRDVNYTFDFIPSISQNITSISLEEQPLKQLLDNAFRNVSSQSSLTNIRLPYCQISHVDAGALLNLHNLTHIYLSHNALTQIDSKLFSETKQLIQIDMSDNKIEVLASGLFENLPLLARVYLAYNRIRQLEACAFKNTPSLQIIDLDHNQIEFLNVSFKDQLDNPVHLWLNYNPWKCDCELGPLYEFLIETNLSNEQELVCEKPPTLRGRKWNDISKEEFVCAAADAATLGQYWIMYPIILLVIGVVFVVRCVLLRISNRRHIRVPSNIKRRSTQRTNTFNMDTSIEMSGVQSRAVLERGDSALNMAEEQTFFE